MKKLIIISIFSLLFSEVVRHEIISRHSNGNKKIVVTYEGEGINEKIIERKTFSETDQILLIERPLEKIKIEYSYNWWNKEWECSRYENGILKVEKDIQFLKGYWKRIEWGFVGKKEEGELIFNDDNEYTCYSIFNDTSNIFYSFKQKGEDYTLEDHLISYLDYSSYSSSCDDTLNIKKSSGKILLGFEQTIELKETVERKGEWRIVPLSKDTVRLFFPEPEQEIEFYEIYIRVDSKTLPSYLKEILD